MNGENDATVHQLMNEVTECLQYARGLTGLLAQLVEGAGEVNGKDLAMALRAWRRLWRRGVGEPGRRMSSWFGRRLSRVPE